MQITQKNQPFSLLVVDFSLGHRLIIEHNILKSMPQASPVFRSTAEEALNYLESLTKRGKTLPKLILMDIFLPVPEAGWKLLKELKLVYSLIPVLVLSADSQRDTILMAYELGAHSFIEKPAELDQWESVFYNLRNYWLRTVTLPD